MERLRIEHVENLTNDRFRQARKYGYRSGLEVAVARQLDEAGVEYQYEGTRIPFVQPAKQRYFSPDFILPNGIVIETKGRFVTADRQKHILVKRQYPDLDLRFVFSRSTTRISKKSKTTYAKWCEAKGFQFADKTIPEAWLTQPRNVASLSSIAEIRGTSG